MKVSLAVESFDPHAGGLEAWTYGFVRYLCAVRHDVHVLTFSRQDFSLPVTVHLLPPTSGILDRAMCIAARRATVEADVSHDSGSGLGADVFQPQTGSLLHSMDRLIASFPLPKRLRYAVSSHVRRDRRQLAELERRQVTQARRIIAVSGASRADIASRYQCREASIAVIPNGVDLNWYSPDRLAPLREASRARLGLGGAITFLLTAHNLRLKGLDTALNALAGLLRKTTNICLLVAGGAPDAAWRRLVAKLGLGGHVMFLGMVPQMDSIYAAADICLHPTRWDACSLTTIEAMAAALPIITTAANGAAEILSHGVSGLILSDPEDVDSLCRYMEIVLDPKLRRQMGEAARKAALQHNIQDNYQAVTDILESLAAVGRTLV